MSGDVDREAVAGERQQAGGGIERIALGSAAVVLDGRHEHLGRGRLRAAGASPGSCRSARRMPPHPRRHPNRPPPREGRLRPGSPTAVAQGPDTTFRAMAGNSKRAIIAALFANLGIAVAKFVGFLDHRLVVAAGREHPLGGRHRATRPCCSSAGGKASKQPTAAHPFGYGRERYFWSFVVALVLFSLGSLFAIYEGIEKLRHPHELESPAVAIGILLVAIVLESWSFRTAVRESRPLKGDLSWWQFIRRAKQPELPVVLLEDFGALIGLVIALDRGRASRSSPTTAMWDALGTLHDRPAARGHRRRAGPRDEEPAHRRVGRPRGPPDHRGRHRRAPSHRGPHPPPHPAHRPRRGPRRRQDRLRQHRHPRRARRRTSTPSKPRSAPPSPSPRSSTSNPTSND